MPCTPVVLPVVLVVLPVVELDDALSFFAHDESIIVAMSREKNNLEMFFIFK